MNSELGQVPSHALGALAIVDGPVLALVGIASFLSLFKYRVARSRHEATLAELVARHRPALAESISPGSTNTREREAGRA